MRPETTGDTENGRSISVVSDALAAKLELRDAPGGGDTESGVHRNRDRRDEQGQPDRSLDVRIGKRREVAGEPMRERLGEDDRERHEEKQAEEGQRRNDQQRARKRAFAGDRLGAAPGRAGGDGDFRHGRNASRSAAGSS